MTVAGDITRYFTHTVWIVRGPTGDEGSGADPVWHEQTEDAATPTIVEVRCRIFYKHKTFRGRGGIEVVATNLIIFARPAHPDHGVEIGPRDQFLFDPPDDIDAASQKRYAIVSRERHDGWDWDTDPRAHWEVWAC